MKESSEGVQFQNNNEIVRVLLQNAVLIRNWKEFYGSLELNNPSIDQWTLGYNNSSLTIHSIFKNIIESWKSEKGNAATLSSLCETLRKMGNTQAADSLEEEFCLSNITKLKAEWPLYFNVGNVNPYFVGRQREQDQLDQIRQSPYYKSIVISGLGGIGKTELTKKFAHRIFSQENVNCAWFNGETEECLKQSLTTLAHQIRISTQNKSRNARTIQEMFNDLTFIMNNSKSSQVWLVIFDNVDELYPSIQYCLESLHKTDRTLTILTSRKRNLATHDMFLIPMEEWDTPDAVQFVKLFLEIKKDTDDVPVYDLCSRLGNFALAMQQAVAYIIQQQRNSTKGNSYSIKDYLAELDAGGSRASNLLDHKLSPISHTFVKTLFVTWDVSITKMKSNNDIVADLALQMLNKMAYLDPSSIDFEFLLMIFNENEETKARQRYFEINGKNCTIDKKELLNKALELLKAYSFIKAENCVITIHRLVQEVIRLKLNLSNEEVPFLCTFIEQLSNGPSLKKSNMPHVLSVWKHASQFEPLIHKFVNIPWQISDRLHDFGLYSEMFSFTSWNHVLLIKVLGELHPATLEIEDNLGRAIMERGEFKKSLTMFRKVLVKKKQFFGDEHERTLMTYQNIAMVLYHLNRNDEAKQEWDKLFESRTKILGENHPDTMGVKHNLALVFSSKGEYDLALKIDNEVLKWRKKVLGELHPHTLSSMKNIGALLFQKQKYWEAKDVLENAWVLNKQVLGESHPTTLQCMRWIGHIHSKIGGQQISFEMLQQIVTFEKTIYVQNHPETLITRHYIGICHYNQGKYSEAKTIYKTVYRIMKIKLGKEHRQTLKLLENLASVYFRQRCFKKSLHLFQFILKTLKKHVSPHHIEILNIKVWFGAIFFFQGKYQKAKQIFEATLNDLKIYAGEKNPVTVICICNLIFTEKRLVARNSYSLQISQYLRTIMSLVKSDQYQSSHYNSLDLTSCLSGFNKYCPDRLMIIQSIGSTLLDQGFFREAKMIFAYVLELMKVKLGEENISTIYAMQGLGITQMLLRNYPEGVEILQHVLKKLTNVRGQNHPDTLATEQWLFPIRDYRETVLVPQSKGIWRQGFIVLFIYLFISLCWKCQRDSGCELWLCNHKFYDRNYNK